MSFLGGLVSVGNVSLLLLVVFGVLFLGYALGRIKIKGISLGDAGVFLIALLAGALFFSVNEGGALVLGTGMCFAMKVLTIPYGMPIGIGVGLVGIAMVSVNYFIYKAILKRGKKKYGAEILRLSNEILGE